ncbi:MAG: hypothetical protein R3270_06905 [Gammaproteobacteria bacterium]|nr:hypothetical protein [Gammaproteobacteria bacterium]
MHATTCQLIAIRDREPVDAGVRAHVDGCAECRDALMQLRALRDALRELPDEMPPEHAWQSVERRWEEERRMRQPLPARWIGLAASIALVAVLAWQFVVPNRDAVPVVTDGGSDIAAIEPASTEASLASLQQRSHYLENMLTAVSGSGGRVTSLSTAGTVSELEDSIALIDARLAAGDEYPLNESERRYLWQQRIELLESLVTVRYAQARANSI